MTPEQIAEQAEIFTHIHDELGVQDSRPSWLR